ncbi:MAG: GH3 auxin-responsive promoter family protein [Tannerella sp.]|jgi:hypothetical protein|nr:GH3 auxin-responsive promoter family protein [Tannerella sp.]
MNVINRGASLFFRNRLNTIESYEGRSDKFQRAQLDMLLRYAGRTEWGMKYDYKSIRDYATFAGRLPIQTYDTLKPFIKRMVNGEENILWPSKVGWYAKSSGTSNDKSKIIPVTHEILKHCHYQGGYDTVGLYLRNNPDSRFFLRKGLILGGSHSPSPLNQKARCGDLSAVLIQNIPKWVNLVRIPGKQTILMNEWEAKIKAVVEQTRKRDVGNISGVPSWILVLIKAILKRTGKETLTEVWPNLEVFFHGGISFDPYRTQYKDLIPSSRMRYMEIYNASEGFFGIQDEPSDSSLLLMLDYGVFYEFTPVNELNLSDNPKVIPLEEVKIGENYAMIISTTGGLWRYLIGDTVRFTSLFPHKIEISGRINHFINAFGEELMVDNAEKGIEIACQQTGAVVHAYTAAPVFTLDQSMGRHQWLVEFEKAPASLESFAKALDLSLQSLNSDYEAKRYKDFTLQLPEIIPAREGLFHDWLKMKDKLGGQHKVTRLSNNRDMIEELLGMNEKQCC